MAGSDVSSVTKYFSTVNEGFSTTLGSTIAPSATTVPLNSVTGLTNGTVFVGVIEPGTVKQQVFTGTVDTGGSQITDVVWTRGADVEHVGGVSIVDYVSGTHFNMLSTGVREFASQEGRLVPSALYDPNNTTLETLKLAGVSSAVNEVTIKNAATGGRPEISTTGSDSNIDLSFNPKGTGQITGLVDNLYNPYKFFVRPTSDQTMSSTNQKVHFGTEDFDTGNNFDSVTNHRFTAPVDGFYQFNSCLYAEMLSGSYISLILYKNGTAYLRGQFSYFDGGNGNWGSSISTMIELEANDYIEVFSSSNQSNVRILSTATPYVAYFNGYLVSTT